MVRSMAPRIFHFDSFTVETEGSTIRRNGELVKGPQGEKLKPKAVRILIFLMEKQHRTVLTKELRVFFRQAHDDAEKDKEIARYIWYLRHCLDGDRDDYIKNISKPRDGKQEGGYRFVKPARVENVDIPDDGHDKRFWNVPFQRNRRFIGRSSFLKALHRDLYQNRLQVLCGLGGMGKTHTAVEYAYRHGKNAKRKGYAHVLWLFADSKQSVIAGFTGIAILLGLPESKSNEGTVITEGVKRWLEHSKSWLLIFDNADNPTVLHGFIPSTYPGHILITSRSCSFENISAPQRISPLSTTEACSFLMKHTGLKYSSTAMALAERLSGLPLALEHAAVYIREQEIGFETYFDSFIESPLRLLEKRVKTWITAEERQKKTVATTWLPNFQAVKKECRASSETLCLSAFLAPDVIPFDVLEVGGVRAGGFLQSFLSNPKNQPRPVDDLLAPLARYSLIDKNPAKSGYTVHPLVQEVIRERMPSGIRDTWQKRTIATVAAVFPRSVRTKDWPLCDRLIPHVFACARHISELNLRSTTVARLLNDAGYYLKERARYEESERLYLQALEIRKRISTARNHAAAETLSNLGVLYRMWGQYDRAAEFLQQALKIYGQRHPETPAVLNRLAVVYRYENKGRVREAEPLYLRALKMREGSLGKEHPLTATILNDLGGLYRDLGQYKNAEALLTRAFEIRKKEFGLEHPDTVQTLNNLGKLYCMQKRHEESARALWQALTIREKLFDLDHPNVAQTLDNLGRLCIAQGKQQEAVPLLERALRIRRQRLGETHNLTLETQQRLHEISNTQ